MKTLWYSGGLILAVFLLVQSVSAAWSTETVDPIAGRGEYSSLAIDSAGNRHISYYDSINGNLLYAYRDGAGWHRFAIDIAGDVGRATSIIVTNNRPAISYYDVTNRHLKYAEQNSGGSWWSTTVDSADFSGVATSMVANSIGRPQIAYAWLADSVDTTYNLKFAYWDPDGWHTQVLDNTASVGLYPSIRMMPGRDDPGISYYDQSYGNLKFNERVSDGSWLTFTIHQDGDVGQYSSFAIEPNRYRFCYYNATSGHLEYTWNELYDEGYLKYTVDDQDNTGYFSSMILDKYDMPCIAYYSKDDGYIKYAWNDGIWHHEDVAPAGSPGGDVQQIWPHLAFDPAGNPCISYYNSLTQKLMFARKGGAYPALPSSKDFSKYFTLLGYQGTGGGCGSYTSMHIFEILKEREWSYTPDPSYAFEEYVYNTARDPAANHDLVPYDPTMHQAKLLKAYGGSTETSYPTNYDLYGGSTLNNPPSAAVFTEASNYRIAEYSERIIAPSLEQAKYLLVKAGPYAISDIYPGHLVTMVGYDDSKGWFKVIDSDGWDSKPAGIKTFEYSRFNDRISAAGESIFIMCFKNEPTPLLHPFTSRINVTHKDSRRYLTVKTGVVGQTPLIVWDQNNQVYDIDYAKSLVIDVALPSYAASYWPPGTGGKKWYLTVENNHTTKTATINGFTLVKRSKGPGKTKIIKKYEALSGPITVPANGKKTVYYTRP